LLAASPAPAATLGAEEQSIQEPQGFYDIFFSGLATLSLDLVCEGFS